MIEPSRADLTAAAWWKRLANAYAGVWVAENHHDDEPTDEAFEALFARCARIPGPEEYPAIRQEIREFYGPIQLPAPQQLRFRAAS